MGASSLSEVKIACRGVFVAKSGKKTSSRVIPKKFLTIKNTYGIFLVVQTNMIILPDQITQHKYIPILKSNSLFIERTDLILGATSVWSHRLV